MSHAAPLDHNFFAEKQVIQRCFIDYLLGMKHDVCILKASSWFPPGPWKMSLQPLRMKMATEYLKTEAKSRGYYEAVIK